MNAPTQANDIAFGLASENTNINRIQSFLATPLTKTGEYDVMDWTNENRTIYVELKTRRITHNQYPTALIGANKVAFCNEPNTAYYFCFSYLDGLYYIKYDKNLFATFATNNDFERSYRPDAHNTLPQSIVLIPTNLLQPFP